MRNSVIFYLNGKRHQISDERAGLMLAEYLRYDQALTGTKVVCAEGDCGACSVLRYFPHTTGTDHDHYHPINSCITPVATLDGTSLLTVESLKENDRLHEAQRSMVDCHGSQCGFCTPGFVMALTGLIEEKIERKQDIIDEKEAKNCLTGNLCRCTGYRAIIDAAVQVDVNKEKSLKDRYFDSIQEQELKKTFSQGVLLETASFTFFAPKTMQEAVQYLATHPDTRIIASSTDLGVVHNKRKLHLTKLLSLHLIEELYSIKGKNTVRLGARVSITEFRHHMKDILPEVAKYLDVFAAPQIKNIATVVGNVANASPIGDTPPVLLALDAKVILHGLQGERIVAINDFFLDYRKTDRKPDEIIVAIEFDVPKESSSFRAFKNSNRKDLDISSVNMVIHADWQDDVIKDIRIAAGGIAATPIRLKKAEQALRGQKISVQLVDQICQDVHQEFKPLSDLRASSAYRHILVENYLRRFFKQEATL